ncbi:MAG: type II toxin-antitoxin system RelE/ParE family toxin [Bauldia sp.]
MIRSFRNKALLRFWEQSERRGIRPDLVRRVAILLDALDVAAAPEDLASTQARFHPLHGKPKRFALSVNKNWRITFGWAEKDAIDVDLEDYH